MRELIEAIEQTRAQLFHIIQPLNDVQLNRKLQPGRWSVAQVCQHLILSEQLFTDAIARGLQSKPTTIERKPIELVLDKSKKLESPEIAKPAEDELILSQVLRMFEHSREQLQQLLQSVEDPSVLYSRTSKHVVFKDMALNQWLELLALHEQRHIDQIKGLLRDMNE